MGQNLFFWIVALVVVALAVAGILSYFAAFVKSAKNGDGIGMLLLTVLPFVGILGAVVMLPFVGSIEDFFKPYMSNANFGLLLLVVVVVFLTLWLIVTLPHTMYQLAIGPRDFIDIVSTSAQLLYVGAAICFAVA